MPIYTPAPFIPVQGEGSRLWDQQDREYIDFTGGITVNALGHAHPALREALNDQASKSWHTGNGHTNEPALHLAKRLTNATSTERIFFCNSGVEANEAALKLARKYAHDRFGSQESGIVAFKNTLHGHALLIVSAGEQPAYSQDFVPPPPDIRHAVYNDPNPTSRLIDNTTCAVIVESVRDEDGVVPATRAFLQGLRELCGRHNTLLISNEVQTGVGRAERLYAYMHYGVTPGLLTAAETLGGGSPISALLAAERCASVMTVGTHDTTYGGSPLAAAVVGKLLEIVNTSEVLNGIRQHHDWSVERMNAINRRLGLFSEVRGLGSLIDYVLSAEFAGRVKLISQETAIAGMMVLVTGANMVRFTPVLNVSEKEVATGLDRFAPVCERIKAGGSS